MAHPCFECGGECYCGGDFDDVITSKTPKNCEGCGCNDSNSDDYDWQSCDNCDLPDACEDFGCAIKMGLKENDLPI